MESTIVNNSNATKAPKSGVYIPLTKDEHRALKVAAVQNDIPLQTMVAQMIRDAMATSPANRRGRGNKG